MYRIISREFNKNYGKYFNQKTWTPYLTRCNVQRTFATTTAIGALIGFNRGAKNSARHDYTVGEAMIGSLPSALGGAFIGATFPLSLPCYMITYRQFYDRENTRSRMEYHRDRYNHGG